MDDSQLCHQLYCLIVDGHTEQASATKELLLRANIRAEIALDGNEAVELVYRRPFDLIFMELNLPSVGGIEVTRIIRSLPEMRGWVPIMALTTHRDPEALTRCFQSGMSNYLLKPLSMDVLTEVVSPILQKKQRKAMSSITLPEDS